MFARAVPGPRHIAVLALVLAGAGGGVAGCGQQRQDTTEPEANYLMEVTQASFPAKQHIAGAETMRISVRNRDSRTAPDVAVTVETKGSTAGAAPQSFAQSSQDSRLADPNRPVWVLDREPKGGTTAFTNTWALGPLKAGATKTFTWKVTPVKAGTYTIAYRVFPGVEGKARLKSGSRASGSFKVSVDDRPVPARVNDKGQVVRGQNATAGGN